MYLEAFSESGIDALSGIEGDDMLDGLDGFNLRESEPVSSKEEAELQAQDTEIASFFSEHWDFENTGSEQLKIINVVFENVVKKAEEYNFNQGKKKEPEIERFRALLRDFNRWIINDQKKEGRNLSANEPLFEYKIFDYSINKFIFGFSDIHVNLRTTKTQLKEIALDRLSAYLREKEPDAIVSDCYSHRKIEKEVIHQIKKVKFRFLNGKTDFVIMLNRDIEERLYQMVNSYASAEDRVFTSMCAFVTYWAHCRGLLYKYLSPLTICYMIIFFLQVQRNPILPIIYDPSLKQKKRIKKDGTDRTIIVDLNYDFNSIKSKIKDIPFPNDDPLGELIFAFFKKMVSEDSYKEVKMSCKEGKYLKASKKHGYYLQNPFILCFNMCSHLCYPMDVAELDENQRKCKDNFEKVLNEFTRAVDCLSEHSKIKDLCARAP